MVEDDEALVEVAEDLVYEVMIRLILRRLAKVRPDPFQTHFYI